MKLHPIILCLAMAVCSDEIAAQLSLNASGGEATGTGGSASFSVGQVEYVEYSSGDHSSWEGVQQPYEISVISSISDFDFGVEISVYPNPTSDEIHLQLSSADRASYELVNANGQILQCNSITSLQTHLDMAGFPAATYFLNILQDSRIVKTFQLIKK